MNKRPPPLLDQQLTIERITRTADAQGGYAETWETLYTPFAELLSDGSGAESSRDGERIEATGRVVFRFYRIDAEGLLESDRVVWNGVTYNIDHISPVTHGLFRTMSCTRGKAT